MKKLFLSTLIVALIFVCTISLVSCKKQCETCSFGEWQTVTEPTCTVEGEKVRTCTVCEAEERQPIEKLEHEVFFKETKSAPTCTAKGVDLWACKNCDYTQEKSINAKGHKYGSWTETVAATCSAKGTQERTCENCGEKDTKSVAALGHKYGNFVTVKNATCTAEGIKKATCSVCGDAKEEATRKTSHNYSAATCTNPKTCKACGITTGGTTAHDYSAATCTKPKTCKACGGTTGSTISHDYTVATCTKAKTCKTCGVTTGETAPHNYSAATCTEAKECYACGKIEGDALGHTVSSGECGRCGQMIINQARIDAIEKENNRHENALNTLKARKDANIEVAERTIDSLKQKNGISYVYSASYYNSQISSISSKIDSKIQKWAYSTNELERKTLDREITELRKTRESYYICLNIISYQDRISSYERDYDKGVADENMKHKENLEEIDRQYGN